MTDEPESAPCSSVGGFEDRCISVIIPSSHVRLPPVTNRSARIIVPPIKEIFDMAMAEVLGSAGGVG
jgi:hypothetical protein